MQNSSRQLYPAAQESTKTPRPATQVDNRAANVEAALESLDKALIMLAEKLEPVLRVEPPADANKGEPPDEMLVPVADQMRRFEKRISAFIRRVESLTERTEA